jgi:hypothetical protein
MATIAGLRGPTSLLWAQTTNSDIFVRECRNENSLGNFNLFWEQVSRVVISGKARSHLLPPSFFSRFGANEIAESNWQCACK